MGSVKSGFTPKFGVIFGVTPEFTSDFRYYLRCNTRNCVCYCYYQTSKSVLSNEPEEAATDREAGLSVELVVTSRLLLDAV